MESKEVSIEQYNEQRRKLSELLKGKPSRKTVDGYTLCDLDGWLIRINKLGRQERILTCEIIKLKKGIRLANVVVKVIDEGIVEKMEEIEC